MQPTVEETVNTLFKQLQGTDQDKADALEFIRRPEYLRLRLHPAFVRAVLDLKETGLFGFVDDVDDDEEDVCPHCGQPLE